METSQVALQLKPIAPMIIEAFKASTHTIDPKYTIHFDSESELIRVIDDSRPEGDQVIERLPIDIKETPKAPKTRTKQFLGEVTKGPYSQVLCWKTTMFGAWDIDMETQELTPHKNPQA